MTQAAQQNVVTLLSKTVDLVHERVAESWSSEDLGGHPTIPRAGDAPPSYYLLATAKHILSQIADLSRDLAILISDGAAIASIDTLSRTILELGSQLFWIFEPLDLETQIARLASYWNFGLMTVHKVVHKLSSDVLETSYPDIRKRMNERGAALSVRGPRFLVQS